MSGWVTKKQLEEDGNEEKIKEYEEELKKIEKEQEKERERQAANPHASSFFNRNTNPNTPRQLHYYSFNIISLILTIRARTRCDEKKCGI